MARSLFSGFARALGVCAALVACAPAEATPDAGSDAPVDAGVDAPWDPCDVLFGVPNAHTGLDDSECQPVCACGADRFVPRTWSPDDLDHLRAYVDTRPSMAPTSDPYTSTPLSSPPDTVCGVIVEDVTLRTYHVETYASQDAAIAAGAVVTHSGACGVCSNLVDLAVYVGVGDLTVPVRQCGIDHLSDFEGLVACIAALGFTDPCSRIWAYNTEHTRTACGSTCIALLSAPYNTATGALNACLACDEQESGPVFKAVAGRTRRNSGIPNAICRPCAEVVRLQHDYPGL